MAFRSGQHEWACLLISSSTLSSGFKNGRSPIYLALDNIGHDKIFSEYNLRCHLLPNIEFGLRGLSRDQNMKIRKISELVADLSLQENVNLLYLTLILE